MKTINKKNKRLAVLFFIASLIVVFIISPVFPVVLSMSVMSIYSQINKSESMLPDEDFDVKIPGGFSTKESDWYPFVMYFTDNKGFQKYTENENLSLTILYNFPSFDNLRGCSRIYDSDSPYYSSFYGAYLVSDSTQNAYGFEEDGSINIEEITYIPEFDYYWLVLNEFGLSHEDFIFENISTEITTNVSYLVYDGWTKIDTIVNTNGISHKSKGFTQSYLQYGRPNYETDSEFEAITLYGRTYARYFPEYNTSIFMYILSASSDVIDSCDSNILSKSTIK